MVFCIIFPRVNVPHFPIQYMTLVYFQSTTEVDYPQTYFYCDGPMGSVGFKVLYSTTNSVTLGIYDRNKPLPQKPGDDFVQFEQVGTKVINLAD